jgi:hypothetical protein
MAGLSRAIPCPFRMPPAWPAGVGSQAKQKFVVTYTSPFARTLMLIQICRKNTNNLAWYVTTNLILGRPEGLIADTRPFNLRVGCELFPPCGGVVNDL